VIGYKFLRHGAVGPFTDHRWPAPRNGDPGAWVEASGPLGLCENGVHACRLEDLPYWLDAELWLVELGGEVEACERQILAGRARLLRRVEAWTPALAREYGLACMLRASDLGAGALAAAGLAAEAQALPAAGEPDEVDRAGHAGSAAALAAGAVRAARASEVAGTAGWHMAFPPATPRYVSYAAFAAYSAVVAAGTIDPEGGDLAERRRQADWLAERLELAR
jgi:hypothetical protein